MKGSPCRLMQPEKAVSFESVAQASTVHYDEAFGKAKGVST